MKNESVTKWLYYKINDAFNFEDFFKMSGWLKFNILPRESFYEYVLWAQSITLRSYLFSY